jgi:hypothetical protein
VTKEKVSNGRRMVVSSHNLISYSLSSDEGVLLNTCKLRKVTCLR